MLFEDIQGGGGGGGRKKLRPGGEKAVFGVSSDSPEVISRSSTQFASFRASHRVPQSAQSLPRKHVKYSDTGPPASHSESNR